MLEDKLLLRVGLKHDGVFIERADAAGDFSAVQQMHGDVLSGRRGHVEERFLDTDHRHGSAKDLSGICSSQKARP